MIDSLPDFPLTMTNVLWALGSATAITTATAVITWQIRKDVVDQAREDLKILQSAEKWKLPETLTHLNALSEKLRLEITEREEFDALKTANLLLSAEAEKKAAALQVLEAKTTDLERLLANARVVGTEFQIAIGQTYELVKPHVVLGLINISLDRASIRVLNKEYELSVGSQLPIEHGGQRYLLTVREFERSRNPYKATFTFYSLDK